MDERPAVLNLTVAPYAPPTDPDAVVLDLADTGAAPPHDLPIPLPSIMVSTHYVSERASQNAIATREHHHDTPTARNPSSRRHATNQGRALQPAALAQGFDRVPARDHQPAVLPWARSLPHTPGPVLTDWEQPNPHQRDAAHLWDIQAPKQGAARQGFNDPIDHNIGRHHQHRDTVVNWQPRLVARDDAAGPLDMRTAPYIPPGGLVVDFELAPKAVLEREAPPTRSVDARYDRVGWSLKDALDGRTIHPWDRKPRLNTEVQFPVPIEPDPVGDPPPEPEIKRTYVIMNASSLIALPSGTPLDFADLNISLDADSFAWSMSARILNRASMDLIRPTAEGPAEVIAMINGHEWRFVIERYSLDGRFAREQYQVSGVSRAQLLAAPYAPKLTGRVEAPINMSQLMAQLLEYTGFTVELQPNLTDYVIPAGAWGWDNKTAMEVIAELASAVGAVVVPDREQDVLHIRHRYKQIGPWNYPAQPIENIDAVIADAMTTGYSSQWEPQPEYNAVFVSGVTAGVAVDVIRTSTPGDKSAPDIFDDLNVDPAQCRLRGLNAIAAGGNQEIVTIETVLPTSGAPGLIEPAMLVEFRDTREPAKSWRGNALSNSLTVAKPGAGRVMQTVKVERHHY